MAIGTLAAIAAGISAATGIGQAAEARKARKQQEAQLRQQRTEATEAAARRDVLEDTGAEVVLGSDTGVATATGKKKRRTTARTSVLGKAGGLGVANRIGL